MSSVGYSGRCWYFANWSTGKQGPFNEVDLTDKLMSGELRSDSLVWNGSLATKWTRLSNVPGLLPRLRRKSRGFSLLDEKLKKITKKLVKKEEDGLRILVSDYECESDSDSTESYQTATECESVKVEDEIAGGLDRELTRMSSGELPRYDSADESEEKCPILSCRPLIDFKSERSEDMSGSPEPRLVKLPSLIQASRSVETPYMSDYYDSEGAVTPVPKDEDCGVSLGFSPIPMGTPVTVIVTDEKEEEDDDPNDIFHFVVDYDGDSDTEDEYDLSELKIVCNTQQSKVVVTNPECLRRGLSSVSKSSSTSVSSSNSSLLPVDWGFDRQFTNEETLEIDMSPPVY